MKIDVTKKLVDLSGKVLTQPKQDQDRKTNEKPEMEDITLKMVSVNAILAADPRKSCPGEEKVKRYELAKKIYVADTEVELSAEDIVLIKNSVHDGFQPLISGQVAEILEGKKECPNQPAN